MFPAHRTSAHAALSVVRTSASGGEGDWTPTRSFPGQLAQCRRDAGDVEPARRRGGRVLERLRQPAGAPQAAVGDCDAPGVPNGAEDRLLVVPPDPADLQVELPTEVPRGGSSDPAVHQDELSGRRRPAGSGAPTATRWPGSRGGGRNHHRGHRRAGHIDGHDTLRALGAAVGAASVKRDPPFKTSPARCASMTTIDGVDPPLRPVGAPLRAAPSRPAPRCRCVLTSGTVTRPGSKGRTTPEVASPATGLGELEHRVHDGPQVIGVPAASLARRVGHWLPQVPLLAGQITWIRHARTVTT